VSGSKSKSDFKYEVCQGFHCVVVVLLYLLYELWYWCFNAYF